MRLGRPNTIEGRQKVNARQKSRMALIFGDIVHQPCGVCGSNNVEMHHPDYSKPMEVVFLCRKHHAELHKELRRANNESIRQATENN